MYEWEKEIIFSEDEIAEEIDLMLPEGMQVMSIAIHNQGSHEAALIQLQKPDESDKWTKGLYQDISSDAKLQYRQLILRTSVSENKPAPTTFGELSDEEKGLLLLAQREKRKLQYFDCDDSEWMNTSMPKAKLLDGKAYRIKPGLTSGTVEMDENGNPNFETWAET